MIEKCCRHCNSLFFAKSKQKQYCSDKCKWTHNNNTRTLKPNQFFKCVVCEKSVERYIEPSKIKQGKVALKYCSRKCKGADLSGENHPMWNGGEVMLNGYVCVRIPDHPHAKSNGYILKHRFVMEQQLGRYLTSQEVVHHINGDTQDNRPENLMLFPDNATHKRFEDSERERNALGQYEPTKKERA